MRSRVPDQRESTNAPRASGHGGSCPEAASTQTIPAGGGVLPADARDSHSVFRIGVFGRRGSGKTALVRRLAGLPPIPPLPDNGPAAGHRCRLAGIGASEVTESPALEECAVHRTGMRDRFRTALAGVDLALLVMDPRAGYGEHEEGLLLAAEQAVIPVVGVLSKGDLRLPHDPLADFLEERGLRVAGLSAWTGEGCAALAAAISETRNGESPGRRPARPAATGGPRGGVAVFVLPPAGGSAGVDPAVVRAVVSAGGTLVVCRSEELPEVLRRLGPFTPVLV